ncbi:MAG TPA: potassium channel family protein [Candidatus Omnitrophota bacterium]|nr:potassium channel family protein [Candidatus Omnitrophota bacterium]HPT07917.1 potassium channel family protein [Candidatus Omnitrophota bacterium]
MSSAIYLFPVFIFIAYAAAIIILVTFFVPIGRELLRLKTKKEEAGYIKKVLIEKFHVKIIEKEEINNQQTFFDSRLWIGISLLKVLYELPVFIIRIWLISFNYKIITRTSDFFYQAWYLLLICFAFALSLNNHTITGLIVSVLTLLFSVEDISAYFRPDKKGIMQIVSLPRHKLRISSLLGYWFLVLLSYGGMYFALSRVDNSAFSVKLGIFDSIYFSFQVVSSITYGDIMLRSRAVKIIAMSEGLIGIIFVAVVITIFLNFWLKVKDIAKMDK